MCNTKENSIFYFIFFNLIFFTFYKRIAKLFYSKDDNLESVLLEAEYNFIDLINPTKDTQSEMNKKYFLPKQLDVSLV